MLINKKRILSSLCAVIMVLVWCIVPSPAQRVSAADDDVDVYALFQFPPLLYADKAPCFSCAAVI